MHISKRWKTSAAIGLLAVPMIMYGRSIDPEYRACMQQAVQIRDTAIITARQTYLQAEITAMQRRMEAYVQSWNHAEQDDQYDATRDADKAYRKEVSDADDVYDDTVHDARDTYRDMRRDCEDARRDRERAARDAQRRSV